MKKKNKILTILGKSCKDVATTATANLNLFEGLGAFLMTVIFVSLFGFGWVGIVENVFESYFEMVAIALLMFIAISQIRIRYNNGILGLAVMFYLGMGFLAIISREFSLLDLGLNVVKLSVYITCISLIYKFLEEGGLIKKWLLKYRKQ